MSNDVNDAMKMLIEMINDSLEVCAPLKKIRTKKVEEMKLNLSNETIQMIDHVDIQKDIAQALPNDLNEKILYKL